MIRALSGCVTGHLHAAREVWENRVFTRWVPVYGIEGMISLSWECVPTHSHPPPREVWENRVR